MANENRGVQFALIVFVMLTVVLGVTTFIFFNNAQEAKLAVEASDEQARKYLTQVETMNEEIAVVKDWMAGRGDIPLAELEDTFTKDIRTTGIPEPGSYHVAVNAQQRARELADSELADRKEEIRERDKTIERLESTKTPQVDRHRAAAEKAMEDLAALSAASRKRYKEITSQYKAMRDGLEKIQREAVQDKAAAKERYAQLADVHERLQRDYQILSAKYKRLKGELPVDVVPQGRVVRVSPAVRKAWIDVGRRDGLPRQTGFDVYPGTHHQLSPSDKKGEIQVTRIVGDDMAEAQILDDQMRDPIVGGDAVHSTTWRGPKQGTE